MGEMKRAPQLRNRWCLSAEIKRKSRDDSAAHFPIAANARTDEFHERFWRFFMNKESNYSGRLSHVSSQPVMIPSSRALLSRDKRLPLDTWNTSGLQENVFGNQFSTCDSHQDRHQGIHPCVPQKGTRISSTCYRDGDSFRKR